MRPRRTITAPSWSTVFVLKIVSSVSARIWASRGTPVSMYVVRSMLRSMAISAPMRRSANVVTARTTSSTARISSARRPFLPNSPRNRRDWPEACDAVTELRLEDHDQRDHEDGKAPVEDRRPGPRGRGRAVARKNADEDDPREHARAAEDAAGDRPPQEAQEEHEDHPQDADLDEVDELEREGEGGQGVRSSACILPGDHATRPRALSADSDGPRRGRVARRSSPPRRGRGRLPTPASTARATHAREPARRSPTAAPVR